jgi:hypothetical protein
MPQVIQPEIFDSCAITGPLESSMLSDDIIALGGPGPVVFQKESSPFNQAFIRRTTGSRIYISGQLREGSWVNWNSKIFFFNLLIEITV